MTTEDWYQVWRGINVVIGAADLVWAIVLIRKHYQVKDPIRMLLQALTFMILVMWSLSIQSFVISAQGHVTPNLTPRAVGLTAGMLYTLWVLSQLRRNEED